MREEIRDSADFGMKAIEVSGMMQPRIYRGAFYRDEAEQLAARACASVIVTGGIRSLQDMEEMAAESNLQFFGMS